MKNRSLFISLLILGVALAGLYLKYFYAYIVFGVERYRSMDSDARNMLIQGTVVLLCFGVTYILSSFSIKRGLALLGLRKNVLLPLAAAFACSLPMFGGGYIMGNVKEFSFNGAFQTTFWAGFNEELVYRAFIAGLLIRLVRWPFLPAAVVSSLFFAYGHLYQAQSFQEILMVLSLTCAAGVGFTVFYRMWNWNLWFVIGLHSFMNLSFAVFDLGDNVLLSGAGNVFRGTTIFLAILASLIYQRRTKLHAKEEVPIVVLPNR